MWVVTSQLSKLISRAVPLFIQWSEGTRPEWRSTATTKDGRPLPPDLFGQ